MRAVVEKGLKSKDDDYPPLEVLVVNGEHNVTIKVCNPISIFISIALLIFDSNDWRRGFYRTYLRSFRCE